MFHPILYIIGGLLAGACLGAFAIALAVIARDADEGADQ
jgi:formate-dependent nitrite reductase membrane component NrfD